MTDPFTAPGPQEPQEPTPVYDSANPAGAAPQAPNPYEQPQAYSAPAGTPAFGIPAPSDPNAAAFQAPAYGNAPAAADPNAAAFNSPAPAVPSYGAPAYPAPAPVDPTAATYGAPSPEAPAMPPMPAYADPAAAYGATMDPAPAAPVYADPMAAPQAASYTTSTGLPYAGAPSYGQMPPTAAPGYAPAQPGMPMNAPYGATPGEPPINMPWYGIDFLNAIKRFFTKYATFSGRASRGEFWWVFLFLALVSVVFNLLTRASGFFNVLSAIWGLATIVPQIALAVRRVHDANLPGGWVALPYGIEVVGAMVISLSMVGTVASGLSGSSSGLGGGVAGMLIGALIVLGGAVTAIVLFAKKSDPQGARFDRQ